MSNELFIWATRNKVRFPFKGNLAVEDLWDLSVTDLDKIFKSLKALEKKASEESLLHEKSKEDAVLSNKIEIVKFIVSVKLDEREKAKKAAENREKKQKIMELIAKKDNEAMENMSKADLLKMLDDME